MRLRESSVGFVGQHIMHERLFHVRRKASATHKRWTKRLANSRGGPMLQQSCRIPARASAFWHARELSRGEIEARGIENSPERSWSSVSAQPTQGPQDCA